MKRKVLLFVILVLVSPLRAHALSLFSEAMYSCDGSDIFVYARVPSVLSFTGNNGISLDDLSFLMDQKADDTTRRMVRRLLPQVQDLLYVVEAEEAKKDHGILFLKETGGVMLAIRASGKTYRSSKTSHPIYLINDVEGYAATRVENITMIARTTRVEDYLVARAQHRRKAPAALDVVRTASAGTSFYGHVAVSEYMKEIFGKMLEKGSQRGSGLDENVFIQALANTEIISYSARLSSTVDVAVEMRGASQKDGERLVMVSHFLIVGTSLVVPFMSMIGRSLAGEVPDVKDESLVKLQKMLGRIATEPVPKGVRMSFRFNNEETSFLVQGMKAEVVDAREKTMRNIQQEKVRQVFVAIEKDDPEAMERALSALEDKELLRSAEGETPLSAAVKNGSEKALRQLIRLGFDVNEPIDSCDSRPLHVAAELNKVSMVRILVDAGAVPSLMDCRANTPLQIARQRGFTEIVELLEPVENRDPR